MFAAVSTRGDTMPDHGSSLGSFSGGGKKSLMLNIGYEITCMVAKLRLTVARALFKLAAGVWLIRTEPRSKMFLNVVRIGGGFCVWGESLHIALLQRKV